MPNGDIIIKSGSVELDFDEGVYPKDPANPRKHKNPSKKITRVVIAGDVIFDSGTHPSGLECDITIVCK